MRHYTIFALQTEDGAPAGMLRVEQARSFWQRFWGLMGRRRLPKGEALLLAPCNSIHMCFMRFAIDAVYLDEDYRIIKVVRYLRPWLGVSMCLGACAVLEVAAEPREYLYRSGMRLVEQ